MFTGHPLDISPIQLTGPQWEAIFARVGDITIEDFADVANLLAEAQQALDTPPSSRAGQHSGRHLGQRPGSQGGNPLSTLALADTSDDNNWTFILIAQAGALRLATEHLPMTSVTDQDERSSRDHIRAVLHDLITYRNQLLLDAATTTIGRAGIDAYVDHAGLDTDHLAELQPYHHDISQAVTALLTRYGPGQALIRMRALTSGLPPLATVQAAQLICPHCGQADTIAEIDTATRRNGLTLLDDSTVAIELQQTVFERERFACLACATTIRLHPDLGITYTSTTTNRRHPGDGDPANAA